ncbi:DNA mismatch repair protein MutS [Sedimentisphaera salicampi]|uniref:DNA mismatch repair protein MutS n=1 Tax=Sedimentisphaera salicampi TaxID=1941349 RepID=A0A1W6LLI1_9BACT|nr:DNA mismatch repair protein MutS [Sedimentisphaera salicampi]ARN56650.1 DNA mismatch repair protein MutS [Sedimentisphaera salicampi]
MAANNKKLTPAMKQFHSFKEKYPDAVLFFRMGDFYETFYEDAKICSRVLGIALTSRGKDSSSPIPLAGIPYHAVDNYLKKIIEAGYKVAVCEQVEDPKEAKGVVKRDVVRVVTPGTITDDILLEAKEDNFLCAVHLGRKSAAIAYLDISTGKFCVQRLPEAELADEICRLSPRECITAERRGELFGDDAARIISEIKSRCDAVITERPGWYFEPNGAMRTLTKLFGTKNLEGFGIEEGSDIIPAAGAIIEYLNETQKTTLSHIRGIKVVERNCYLQIDQTSLRSLEILRTLRSEDRRGSLLWSIDKTRTGMGGRLFNAWMRMPLCDKQHIDRRLDAAGEFAADKDLLDSVTGQLKNFADLERIASRISTMRAGPKDFVMLADTLEKVGPIKETLGQCSSPLLQRIADGCDKMEEFADLLRRAINPECPSHTRDGGVVMEGFSEELDRLRSLSRDANSWLAEYQAQEAERIGIANLKVGFNKVFGYYIEVSNSMKEKVPEEYIRKQTIKNAERYITEKLKEFEQQILTARDRALELENRLFDDLRCEAVNYVERLQKLSDSIAAADCISSIAALSLQRGYVRPEITEDKSIQITEGRHPVIAENLGSEFVSNDLELGDESGDVMIITGPNMSGKSTYIRQTALLVIMAQMGCFIPAKEARIGVVDRIFTRVGASDELSRGQSTFMVEMTETANIVNNATDRSLVILDEVGRGTSTYDGLSIAWAVTEHIANHIGCRTLFATHYHELVELSELLRNVKNCNVAVREWMDDVVFLHKILPGATDKSYGIHVAKLAGLPERIVRRSKEILSDLENTFSKEAEGAQLSRNRTTDQEENLFSSRHRDVLNKLAETDVNNLTPIEAITLLSEVKKEISDFTD